MGIFSDLLAGANSNWRDDLPQYNRMIMQKQQQSMISKSQRLFCEDSDSPSLFRVWGRNPYLPITEKPTEHKPKNVLEELREETRKFIKGE